MKSIYRVRVSAGEHCNIPTQSLFLETFFPWCLIHKKCIKAQSCRVKLILKEILIPCYYEALHSSVYSHSEAVSLRSKGSFFHLAQLSYHLRMWCGYFESMSKECEITHVWRTLKEAKWDIISRHVLQDALLSHPYQNPHSLGEEERCRLIWTSITSISAHLSLVSATFLITSPSFAPASLISVPPRYFPLIESSKRGTMSFWEEILTQICSIHNSNGGNNTNS